MTTESTAVAVIEPVRVDLGVIRADNPAQIVALATEAADALAGVIKAKKLFSSIQGKEYVRVEGWTTLATMMGCLPREVSMTRDEAGTYTATVELVRMHDGAVMTRASAECGMDEPTWKTRADYARRSMAATRAVSKACRLAFSWVMVLAGYEATPSEEIPQDVPAGGRPSKPQTPRPVGAPGGKSPGKVETAPLSGPTAAELSEKPKQLTETEPAPWVPQWKGKPLTDFASPDLVTLRNFCQKKDPVKYAKTIEDADSVLASREGE